MDIKQNIKFIIVGLFSLVLFLIIAFTTSCSTNSQSVEVEDAQGNVQIFDKKVEKVFATQNPIINHVIAIGAGDKYLSGLAYNEVSENLYKEVVDNWNNLHSIWKGHELDVAGIQKTNSDVALIAESQINRIQNMLENAGLRTFVTTPAKDSTTSVIQSISRIGKLLNADARADKLVKLYDEIINEASYAVKNCKDEHTVLFMGKDKNEVVGQNLIQDEIIERAHGKNAVVEYAKDHEDFELNNEGFVYIDDDTIAKINPEMILIPSYAKFNVKDILDNPKLANTTAVKNNYVYSFPSKLEPWDYPTLASCLGIAYSVYCIHPELYSQEKFMSSCNKFYTTLYGKTFNEKQLGL